jgi:hypothetical protein
MREVGKRAETKLFPCFHQLRSWGVSLIQHTLYTYDLEGLGLTRAAHLTC